MGGVGCGCRMIVCWFRLVRSRLIFEFVKLCSLCNFGCVSILLYLFSSVCDIMKVKVVVSMLLVICVIGDCELFVRSLVIRIFVLMMMVGFMFFCGLF